MEFPEFLIMMARQCAMTTDKEHLHWQETFRVFTTPSSLPGTTTKVSNFRQGPIKTKTQLYSNIYKVNLFLGILKLVLIVYDKY